MGVLGMRQVLTVNAYFTNAHYEPDPVFISSDWLVTWKHGTNTKRVVSKQVVESKPSPTYVCTEECQFIKYSKRL